MPSATLAAAGIMALGAGVTYGYISARLFAWRSEPDARGAMRGFALWWGALAANIFLVGITYLMAAFGVLTFQVQLTDSIAQRVLLAISMVGLMRYLLYLRTGRDFRTPLLFIYGVYLAAGLYGFLSAGPTGLRVEAWRTDLIYSGSEPVWTPLLAFVFVILAPIVSAATYFLLYFRVDDSFKKYRIALISWAIIGWWVLAVLAGQRSLLDVGWLQLVSRAISIVTALIVLAAYHPPSYVRRRLRLG